MAASASGARNSSRAADPMAATAATAAASSSWRSRASIVFRRSVHRKHWRARSGGPGTGSQCHGANAEDLVILVPPGTMVIDAKHDLLLKDLAQPGDQVIAARGGKGGKGNTRFKSATNQAPRDFTAAKTPSSG